MNAAAFPARRETNERIYVSELATEREAFFILSSFGTPITVLRCDVAVNRRDVWADLRQAPPDTRLSNVATPPMPGRMFQLAVRQGLSNSINHSLPLKEFNG